MKSRRTAAFLALFLGTFGVHRYYLGQTGYGLMYFFSNFLTPLFKMPVGFILGVIDAIIFFNMSDEDFDRKYNTDEPVKSRRSRERVTRQEKRRQRSNPKYKNIQQQRERKMRQKKRNPFKLSGKKKLEAYELKGAIADLKRSIEISNDDPETHFMLARAYSLTEDADNGFHHLAQAVAFGHKDYDGIKTDDALAYLRIQEKFIEFEKAGYKNVESTKDSQEEEKPTQPKKDDNLLAQLQRLSELREKGLITDEDFEVERKRIMH